jgi:2-phospho-L-lactate guanylyltransferase
MSIWAIIPVKPLYRAKTRLSSVLAPAQRQELAETMLRHVLQVVTQVPQIIGTLVVSRDGRALSIAREYGARTVQESGTPELNSALMRATQVVGRWRGNGVLVLPADLPLIAEADLVGMLELAQHNPSIVIATDDNEDGTNAMLIRPPGLIPYAYGTGSFHRHVELARKAGADVQVYQSKRLALDIDVPADLEAYERLVRYNGHAAPELLVPDSMS